jgi:hypothetical protein
VIDITGDIVSKVTPVEIIRNVAREELRNAHGDEVFRLELKPALKSHEIERFASTLPCPLPLEVRELLEFTSGFETGFDVDFAGGGFSLGCEDIFPNAHPIAADGFGNFWVIDLWPDSKAWGPIYYHSHDAPVILFQSQTLVQFLEEFLNMYRAPFKSAIADVHDDRLFDVSRKNPVEMTFDEALASPDGEFVKFAKDLGSDWLFADLRGAAVGMGFSWGRFGPYTEVKRMGQAPVFAYKGPKKNPGLISKLFGR